jgi:hypothetical protein
MKARGAAKPIYFLKCSLALSRATPAASKLGIRDLFTCDLISRSPFAEAERIRIIRAHADMVAVLNLFPSIFYPVLTAKKKGQHCAMLLRQFGIVSD